MNPTFRQADRGERIGVAPDQLFGPGDSVFAVGSCFAQSVREALTESGSKALPAYENIKLDPTRQMAGPLRHINYYTTFAIRQEFERVLSSTPREPYFVPIAPGRWTVAPDEFGSSGDFEPWDARFQDPLRHGVVAASEEDIIDVMGKVDDLTRAAVEDASAYIITLGMVESWIDSQTGMHMWSSKVHNVAPDRDRYTFHMSNYQENYDNLAWICDTVADRFGDRPIIVTVSPVSMLRTFTGKDIVVANNYGKSMLRTVAGALADDFDHVTYWPSYEYGIAGDHYEEDGRHVDRGAVGRMIDVFLEAHASQTTLAD